LSGPEYHTRSVCFPEISEVRLALPAPVAPTGEVAEHRDGGRQAEVGSLDDGAGKPVETGGLQVDEQLGGAAGRQVRLGGDREGLGGHARTDHSDRRNRGRRPPCGGSRRED